jgi:hypothetical protein
MRVNLPSWPPARLVGEAVTAYNLRHLRTPLDADRSPWPEICKAVFRFLRHRLSGYEQQLYDRAAYDRGYRDALATEIQQSACRQYTWLRREPDPRPFPEPKDSGLFFDRRAHELSAFYTWKDQLHSAIRDLRRAPGDHQAEIAALRKMLSELEEAIKNTFILFRTDPSTAGEGRCLIGKARPGFEGYYFGGRQLAESYTKYTGFSCPECGQALMRAKRPVLHGQGRWMLAHSCQCVSLAVDLPPNGYCLSPVTLQSWTELHQKINHLQKET